MASVPRSTRLSPSPSGARRTVATYSSYEEAERAVDSLSDQKFPVERVAIVGTGLRSVEQVVGRVTTWRAALTGAGQGALIGLFIALLFGLFFTGPGFLGLLAYAVIASTVFGAIFWAIGHALQGGRRDFASVAGMTADRYELQADEEVADEAGRLLDRTLADGSGSGSPATV
jgi:membrane protein required for beta-lactamase induction